MKKNYFKIILVLLLLVTVTGCRSNFKVKEISDWSFQYNTGTNDYSLLIAFNDEAHHQIAADANVDIRIVNNENEVLYENTVSITKENFHYYTSNLKGKMYVADIRIPKDEIKKGKSSQGTVFFTVYNPPAFEFQECNYPISYDLPTEDFIVKSESLPKEIDIKGYDGTTESKVLIENMDIKVDSNIGNLVTVLISGTKTYSGSSYMSIDMFDYQLCDSEGFTVDSGSVFLNK